ncbi:hypothetical protein [Aquisalimonas sp.]|uniref:hypothetical protein n=1 Tax=Aquisalimonas sp. TaxID=1872621 RepID=UPI0025C0CE7F|nr:hypothetical protein [Aquisalimonas sp.]
MLTIEDCIALSDLTEEQVEAIAKHEHIPRMAAVEMGWYLMQAPEGRQRLTRMIIEDIVNASERGDHQHAANLTRGLEECLENQAGAA